MPARVEWDGDSDEENPQNWTGTKKVLIACYTAATTFLVAFASSLYSGAERSIKQTLGGSDIVVTLGLSLFVIGFALGPLLWAPLSEMFGRRPILLISMAMFTLFNILCAVSQTLAMLLCCRFFAAAFGASMLSNGGAVVSDLYPTRTRGKAMALFAAAPFSGPSLAPIVGSYLGESGGFRWVMGLLAILSGSAFLLGAAFLPETYAPILLQRKAQRLNIVVEKHHRSLSTSIIRPFVILLREPIVLTLALYQGVVYAILYSFFAAFPLVFGQARHWSAGSASLPFLSVLVGTLSSVAYVLLYDNKRYLRCVRANNNITVPEQRLPMAMLAAPILPLSLGAFAALNFPSIHWIAPTIFACPFGFAMVILFLATQTYIVDTYGAQYAASALAATVAVRSTLGAIFPLITPFMYSPSAQCPVDTCGIHVGPAIAAAISLLFAPAPFILARYGRYIRQKGTFTQ